MPQKDDSILFCAGGTQWHAEILNRAAKGRIKTTMATNALEHAVLHSILRLHSCLHEITHCGRLIPVDLSVSWTHCSEAWIIMHQEISLGECHQSSSITVNVIVDCILKFQQHDNPFPHFLYIAKTFQVAACLCFYLSAELFSYIFGTLFC